MEMKGERSRLADIVITVVLLVLGFLCLYPILNIVSMSLSAPSEAIRHPTMLWPRDITFDAYRFIFRGDALIQSFQITIFITVVGTTLNLILTTSAAYVLSRTELPGRNFFTLIVIITLVFNAGIIPGYITVYNLGLINSVWAMILPGMVNAFYLLLMRNFFTTSVPDSLIESARLDGASETRILLQIVMPLSLPAIATFTLFYAVIHWNEFFRGVFYITDASKWPLQVLLRGIVVQADLNTLGVSNRDLYGGTAVNELTIRAAAIIAATIPIALIYPFVQRYFVRGIQLGAEKG